MGERQGVGLLRARFLLCMCLDSPSLSIAERTPEHYTHLTRAQKPKNPSRRCSRCKIFVFVKENVYGGETRTNYWKERGTGEVRFLK